RRSPPSNLNCTPVIPSLLEAIAETAVTPATVAPLSGEVIETLSPLVSSSTGTFTMKASNRVLAMLLVQMKYWPVTSRFPLGSFPYPPPAPPGAFMRVMTGATIKTRSEPSRGKHTTSSARGPLGLLAPLPQAYCWSADTPGFAFAWLTCCGPGVAQLGCCVTTVPGPSGAVPNFHRRYAPGTEFQSSAATI